MVSFRSRNPHQVILTLRTYLNNCHDGGEVDESRAVDSEAICPWSDDTEGFGQVGIWQSVDCSLTDDDTVLNHNRLLGEVGLMELHS